jgi:hypothetical protein
VDTTAERIGDAVRGLLPQMQKVVPR